MPEKSSNSQEHGGVMLLHRREIEAGIVGPLVKAFENEFGKEATRRVLRGVIEGIARETGARLAQVMGDNSLPAFSGCVELWKEGGALEIEVLRQDEHHLDFNVTRCRFAEMYHAMGMPELGAILSCQRDFALIEGFNPEFSLERSGTLMQGGPHCDFRFRKTVNPLGASLKSASGDDDPVD